MKKLILTEVKRIFVEGNCELLGKYINSNTLVKYKCECGGIYKIRLNHFRRGHRCKKCGYKKLSNNLSLQQENVKQIFIDGKCKLIGKYINNHTPVMYECECGNISKITLSQFNQGQRCMKCGTERGSHKRKLTQEEVSKVFEDNKCKLLDNYIYSHIPIKYICECNNISKISLNNLQRGQRCKKCGFKKRSEKMSGENHYNYNPNKTDEERKIGRYYPKYKEWVKIVYKQDNYTCQKCKRRGYILNAHHVYSYSKHSTLRTNPDNGITFCKDCHKNFHHIYGKITDFDQLAEFLNYKEV